MIIEQIKNIKKKIATFYYKFYKQPICGTGTHVPALKETLEYLYLDNKEPLTVVEFGTGLFSTNTISEKLNSFKININKKEDKHIFFSLDHSEEWIQKTKGNYKANEKFTIHNFIHSGGDKEENWINAISNLMIQLNNKIPDLVFIDSHPWDSRTMALNKFKDEGKVLIVHDVNWYPEHKLWGKEVSPILYKPKNKLRYGNLKRKNLGFRDYSDVFKFWFEYFPFEPGYYTGPPTLVGSNVIDVCSLILPKLKNKGICLSL